MRRRPGSRCPAPWLRCRPLRLFAPQPAPSTTGPCRHQGAMREPFEIPSFERLDFIRISAPRRSMHPFAQATFLRAVGRPAELLPAGVPELAFAGRSNVGKSSAINALCGRRALARTSKTPGRTQTINFYEIGEEARLVDLPGYGYARVSQAVRKEWRELVDAYLRDRTALALVVLVMD